MSRRNHKEIRPVLTGVHHPGYVETQLAHLRSGNPIRVIWGLMMNDPHQLGEWMVDDVARASEEAISSGRLTREQVIELFAPREEQNEYYRRIA